MTKKEMRELIKAQLQEKEVQKLPVGPEKRLLQTHFHLGDTQGHGGNSLRSIALMQSPDGAHNNPDARSHNAGQQGQIPFSYLRRKLRKYKKMNAARRLERLTTI